MIGKLYNNIGICSLGIVATLQHADYLPISKILLIMPIIAHSGLTSYLARSTTKVMSVEQIIAKQPKYFSNFNDRFYDGIVASINSLQLLIEIAAIEWSDGHFSVPEKIHYEKSMGARTKKIFGASVNIYNLLKDDAANLYTNLRVQI